LNPLENIIEKISTAIIDSPPAAINEGGIIEMDLAPNLMSFVIFPFMEKRGLQHFSKRKENEPESRH